jgi:RNase P subunit RPR2
MGMGKPIVQNGEYLLRMQFLYQAAQVINDITLQRHYVMEAKNISKRQVLRIDPLIKRNICKRCQAQLPEAKLRKGKQIRECQFCFKVTKSKDVYGGSIKINE